MAKQQASNGFTINMILERETKGALRYQEVGESGAAVEIGNGAKIGTLYIRKDALVGVTPKAIKLSVVF